MAKASFARATSAGGQLTRIAPRAACHTGQSWAELPAGGYVLEGEQSDVRLRTSVMILH